MTWQEELKEIFYSNEFGHVDGYEWMMDNDSLKLLETFITALLKKQRESCYKNYLHGFSDDKDWDKNAILNAPEPKP